MIRALAILAALAVPAYAERRQVPDLLEGCTLPVAREKLVDIPDAIQFKLSARDRREVARAIYDNLFGPGTLEKAEWFKKAYDAWIAAGAKMRLLQAVSVPFDLAKGSDRIAVVEYEVKGHMFLGIVAAPNKRWVVLMMVDHHVDSRFVASANIDEDPWIELLFLGRAGDRRGPWWVTGQTRDEPDWRHVEHSNGKSLSLCPQKS